MGWHCVLKLSNLLYNFLITLDQGEEPIKDLGTYRLGTKHLTFRHHPHPQDGKECMGRV